MRPQSRSYHIIRSLRLLMSTLHNPVEPEAVYKPLSATRGRNKLPNDTDLHPHTVLLSGIPSTEPTLDRTTSINLPCLSNQTRLSKPARLGLWVSRLQVLMDPQNGPSNEEKRLVHLPYGLPMVPSVSSPSTICATFMNRFTMPLRLSCYPGSLNSSQSNCRTYSWMVTQTGSSITWGSSGCLLLPPFPPGSVNISKCERCQSVSRLGLLKSII